METANGTFKAASTKTPLPTAVADSLTVYFVPSNAGQLALQQTSSVPAMTSLGTLLSLAESGDPLVGPAGLSKGALCAKSATQSFTPGQGLLAPGLWSVSPTECGPYPKAAPKGVATDALYASMAPFDPGVAVQTADLERLATAAVAGNDAVTKSVRLQPGQSATVNVTFKVPAGTPAGVRRGTLYLDTLQGDVPPYGQVSGDQVAVLPYTYTVPPAGGADG